jgi:diguanylate cyclase (GGDEF)-like protein
VVMALMTVLGTLLRAVSTTVLARAALGYLFVAVSAGLVAVVVSIATSNAAMDSHPRWVNPIWFVSYFGVAAAMLHPSVAYLTTPERVPQDDLSPHTLVGTGLVLTINPLISAVTEFVGPKPDALLLAVGVLLSTPLVLLRFWYLGQQRLRAEQRYAHWAAHDELTGLPNRRQLLAALDQALAERAHLTVLFCDLDGFKPVNDRLGHQAGDELLRVVGQRLRRCVRARDVVGRFGGDEFMIVCVDLPPSGAGEVVARIRATLAEPVALAGGTAVVGASIGVAVTEGGREYTADSLIAEADRAMYAQKHRVTGSRGTSGGSGRSAAPAGRR